MGLKVRFKKLHPSAVIPSYAKAGDAGLDLTAISQAWDSEKECFNFGTGLAVEIPEGYVGLIFPRSSICKLPLSLSNSVGVIDSGYRGEIRFLFRPQVTRPELQRTYELGDRVGQLVILPYPAVDVVEAEELSDTARGTGGFGSSGS